MKVSGNILADLQVEKFSWKDGKKIFILGWKESFKMWRMFISFLKFLFYPTYEGISVIQRLIITPVMELFLGERSAGSAINRIYNGYVQGKLTEKRTGNKTNFAPDFDSLNMIVNELKILKIGTLVFLLITYLVFMELINIVIGNLFASGAILVMINSYFDVSHTFNYIVGGLFTGVYYLSFVFESFLAIVLFRLFFLTLRELNKIDPEEIIIFVNDATKYITQKTIESAGEEIALFSKQATVETIAIKEQQINSAYADEILLRIQKGETLEFPKRIEEKINV